MNDTQTAKTESTANLETELARLDANTKAWLERDNEPDSSHWQTMAIQHRRERDSLTDQRDFAQNLIRILERERNEAREYADTLVAHKDMICLPKDLEVLREANLGLAMELAEAREGWADEIQKGQADLRNAETLYNAALAHRDITIQQRDRLAGALQNLCDSFLGNKSSRDITAQLVEAGEALATLNQPEP
jgi:hypothetical protein